MTMITRPVGSLCVHTALTCLSVKVPVLRSIPFLANMFTSYARNNCPGITVHASCHLEVGLYLCWKWVFCLVVFGCVSMC